MSRVFAPYNPQRRDRRTGELVDVIDDAGKEKAEQFGELVFLLSPSVKPFDPNPVLAEVREKISGFDPEGDYVLLVGNPVIMALVAVAAADESGGPVRFLQWTNGDYLPVAADFSVEDLFTEEHN